LFGQYASIPTQARLLIFLSFMPYLAIGFVYTDLSFFLTTVRGLPSFFTGTVIGVMGIATVATSIPLGILADRYGRRRFLVVGAMLAGVTLAGFALTTNAVLLLAAAAVEGTTETAFATAGAALLAEKAGEANRTAAYSLLSFLSNTAWGLSGFAIPLVLVIESFGLDGVQAHVAMYLILAALSVVLAPLFLKVGESATTNKAKSVREFMPRKSKDVLWKYSVTAVLIAFGAGLFVPLMTQWFSFAFGVPDTVSGPIIGLSGFLIGAASLAAPNLARRFGVVRSIVLLQGLSMVFMVSVPLSPSFLIAGGVYTVRAFIMNVSNPLVSSLVMGLVSPDERGAAAGLSSAIWRLPNSISTGVGGALMGAGLLALPFYGASVLYGISISLFWVFFRRTRLPEELLRQGPPVAVGRTATGPAFKP